ncbi:MAG: flavodoxin family protein, partial [Mobilitalea sp.]
MSKKVVGFSFGRKLSNTEVMIKEALLECEKAGYEIQFVRCDDLNIHICTGCCACVGGMISGNGTGSCIYKDDFAVIDEALMSADAIIVGSPTYVIAPTGNFKTVCDRIGPSHDITFRRAAIESAIAEGKEASNYPDVRSLKKRVGALITVGGARTENWLSLAMPNMYEFTMSMGIDVIDKYQYHAAMNVEHVLGKPEVLERM